MELGRNNFGFIIAVLVVYGFIYCILQQKKDPIRKISALKFKFMIWLTLKKNYPIFKIGEIKFVCGCEILNLHLYDFLFNLKTSK